MIYQVLQFWSWCNGVIRLCTLWHHIFHSFHLLLMWVDVNLAIMISWLGDFLWQKHYNDNKDYKTNNENNDNNNNNNKNKKNHGDDNNNKAMIAIYLSAQRLYIPYIEYLSRI